MITTTVTWPQDGITRTPTPEQIIAGTIVVEQLCGEDGKSEVTVVNQPDVVTITRTWPTLEAANAWVEYQLANYNVSSAVVNE